MAVDSSKLLERDIGISKGARISAPEVKMLKVVNVKLKDVSGNLKDNLVLSNSALSGWITYIGPIWAFKFSICFSLFWALSK